MMVDRLTILSKLTDQIYKAINEEDKDIANELLRKALGMVDDLVYLEGAE